MTPRSYKTPSYYLVECCHERLREAFVPVLEVLGAVLERIARSMNRRRTNGP
jgi:hypothetical protein